MKVKAKLMPQRERTLSFGHYSGGEPRLQPDAFGLRRLAELGCETIVPKKSKATLIE
jgi:hypothetical protein